MFNHSKREPGLREETINLPDPSHDDCDMSHSIIGNYAFPTPPYMMNPFPHHFLFRDRGRGRRVVENTFGTIANRFCSLLGTPPTFPRANIYVVKDCLCLHNIMCTSYPNLQHADLDAEEQDYNIWAWCNAAVMPEVEAAGYDSHQRHTESVPDEVPQQPSRVLL